MATLLVLPALLVLITSDRPVAAGEVLDLDVRDATDEHVRPPQPIS